MFRMFDLGGGQTSRWRRKRNLAKCCRTLGWSSAAAATVAARRLRSADFDAPDLRPSLKVFPSEYTGISGLDLIVQRSWVVVVDDDERRTLDQRGRYPEDSRVTIYRGDGPHVDQKCRCKFWVCHVDWNSRPPETLEPGDGGDGRSRRENLPRGQSAYLSKRKQFRESWRNWEIAACRHSAKSRTGERLA